MMHASKNVFEGPVLLPWNQAIPVRSHPREKRRHHGIVFKIIFYSFIKQVHIRVVGPCTVLYRILNKLKGGKVKGIKGKVIRSGRVPKRNG